MTDKTWWTVNIDLWSSDKRDREIQMEVEAQNGRDALVKAVMSVKMNEDELFHGIHVHIGVPHARRSK